MSGYTRDDNKPAATCIDTADPRDSCAKQKDRARAVRAFYVLTALVVVVSIVVGVLDAFGALNLPGGLKPQIALIAVAAAMIVFTLLSWALAISWPRSKYCGATTSYSKSNGFGWAASPFMMLLAMLVAIGQLVVAILIPGGSGGASEPAK